jgi:pseudouridine kinase
VTDLSKKDQLYELIRANPFISQQELAAQLGLSRSAVAGHIAGLIRDRRLLGRAYVLPDRRPILCIGAANIDRKLRSNGALAMGTSNPARQDESFGGVARNIAENLARLGSKVELITAVGGDAAGAALLAQADSVGIDTRGSLRVEGASGTYTAVLDHDGEMAVALADMGLYDLMTAEFFATRQQQRAAAALIVADLNLPEDAIAALTHDAARDAVPLVLVAVSEPKMARLPRELHGVRALILNEGELATRVGRKLRSRDDLRAACTEVRAQGAQDLIVTLGARGVVHTSGDGIEHVEAPAAEVVDVTGAGDAFAAAACLSLGRGEPLALACRRGLRLSELTLGCKQTVCPDLTPSTLDDINEPGINEPITQD